MLKLFYLCVLGTLFKKSLCYENTIHSMKAFFILTYLTASLIF